MRILCATDLLPEGDAAVSRAASLADQLNADLTLLHVVMSKRSKLLAAQTREIALERMSFRVERPSWRRRRPDIEVRAGSPAPSIVESISQLGARLLVLGPPRQRRVRDLFNATIAEKALAAGACPVLVVRAASQSPYQRVLLALDRSPASISAARTAVPLVLKPGVEARIVHAFKAAYEGLPATHPESWERQTEKALRNLLRRECVELAECGMVVAHGAPVRVILHAIKQCQPDLLVMGTRGLGHLRGMLFRSVANRILRVVGCDALFVPGG